MKNPGKWLALATGLVTLGTFILAVMTPPLSGPFCTTGNCFEYPYTEIASRFPRDYWWMFPAMFISLLFVSLLSLIHNDAPSEKKLFSRMGLSFAIISAAILISDYFIQVTVIQQSLLSGETNGIALLTQFNPHGIFIALEEAGFLLMTLALFAAAPAFAWKSRLGKSIRITMVCGFILALLSLASVIYSYGIMREYIFEVAVISIAWTQLTVFSFLLAARYSR